MRLVAFRYNYKYKVETNREWINFGISNKFIARAVTFATSIYEHREKIGVVGYYTHEFSLIIRSRVRTKSHNYS